MKGREWGYAGKLKKGLERSGRDYFCMVDAQKMFKWNRGMVLDFECAVPPTRVRNLILRKSGPPAEGMAKSAQPPPWQLDLSGALGCGALGVVGTRGGTLSQRRTPILRKGTLKSCPEPARKLLPTVPKTLGEDIDRNAYANA